MMIFKNSTRLHLQKTRFDKAINCRKNKIRILFCSQDIQVGRLKWNTLYV